MGRAPLKNKRSNGGDHRAINRQPLTGFVSDLTPVYVVAGSNRRARVRRVQLGAAVAKPTFDPIPACFSFVFQRRAIGRWISIVCRGSRAAEKQKDQMEEIIVL